MRNDLWERYHDRAGSHIGKYELLREEKISYWSLFLTKKTLLVLQLKKEEDYRTILLGDVVEEYELPKLGRTTLYKRAEGLMYEIRKPKLKKVLKKNGFIGPLLSYDEFNLENILDKMSEGLKSQ